MIADLARVIISSVADPDPYVFGPPGSEGGHTPPNSTAGDNLL
jgi:hypothetical protein